MDLGEEYDYQLQAAMLDCQSTVLELLQALGHPATLETVTCMAVSWALGTVEGTRKQRPCDADQAAHLVRLASLAAAKVVAHWAGEATDVRTLGKAGSA
jgi:hypothetical protein